jgi:hypothetical protein
LLDQRNRKVSRGWHRLCQCREVEKFRPAGSGNGGCGILRNNSCPNLGTGERSFKIENSLNGGDIGEERLDSGRAEKAVQKLHA